MSEDEFGAYRINQDEYCECGGAFIISIDDEIMCEECGKIIDISLTDYIETMDDRIKESGLNDEQRKALYKKLQAMNKNCSSTGLRPFDEEYISLAIDIFAKMRPFTPKPRTRNKNRREQLGACLYVAGKLLGNVRSKKEIQLFCGLPDRNITAALSELQIAQNTGNLDIDFGGKDIKESFTRCICLKIGIHDEQKIKEVVRDVIYIIDIVTSNLLLSSNFDSKTLGAVYISLRLNGFPAVTIKNLCAISFIHTETVSSFTDMVKANWHLFNEFNLRWSGQE